MMEFIRHLDPTRPGCALRSHRDGVFALAGKTGNAGTISMLCNDSRSAINPFKHEDLQISGGSGCMALKLSGCTFGGDGTVGDKGGELTAQADTRTALSRESTL